MNITGWYRNRRRHQMFKHISINLRGPLCSCDEQKLTWKTRGEDGLVLKCALCGTTLNIPAKKFVAHFTFDTPYPSAARKEAEKKAEDEKNKEVVELAEYKAAIAELEEKLK